MIFEKVTVNAAVAAEDMMLASETAVLSEPALAADWNRPEEDATWSHLRTADEAGRGD